MYITKIVVLVSEPVRGRSRATELPWGGGGGYNSWNNISFVVPLLKEHLLRDFN